MTSLLVNFVYAQPVGHAIEALHACAGYHQADPDLRISVALNRATPIELARLCPFIDEVYPVDIDLFDPQLPTDELLSPIPPDWDWVVTDGRADQPAQRAAFPGMARYYDAARDHFRTARPIGYAGAQPPAYHRGTHFRLPLPSESRTAATRLLGSGRPRIALLPGGSGPRSHYPTVASWELVLDALADRFPEMTLCLTGKLADDGRTRTTVNRAEFDRLAERVPRTVPALDRPIVDQLAVVAECDLLLSPHSGFGMAALAVGTPWLSIAGNKWQEFYFNGTPFYSVLPDPERFPCYTGMNPDPPLVEDDGPRSPSMCAERIRADMDEILDAAAVLAEHRWNYETALADHARRLMEFFRGDTAAVWSIDHVLDPYLEAAR
ncbi:MAG TPA: hypothetical protein VHX59_05875 [Mycobacteriales bacterium]|jgi:ADP-heptose:LPS heptosyltransferase|nr:hypothetical protein [Mycobacteriales bacterium]